MKLPKPGPQLTFLVVLCLMGSVLVFLSFRLAGGLWGGVLTGLLVYEGWTLELNDGSTLSEALWALSSRPIVPWAFGLGTGWLLFTHRVEDPFLILVLGFLQGHFWFQRKQ